MSRKKDRRAKTKAELRKLKPRIHRVALMVAEGGRFKDALAQVGLRWCDISLFGHEATAELEAAARIGAAMRFAKRSETIHNLAMAGDERTIDRLIKNDWYA